MVHAISSFLKRLSPRLLLFCNIAHFNGTCVKLKTLLCISTVAVSSYGGKYCNVWRRDYLSDLFVADGHVRARVRKRKER